MGGESPFLCRSKILDVRRIHHDVNLVGGHAGLLQSVAMEIVHGEHAIRPPRTHSLLEHQQFRAGGAARTAKFVAVKFRHRIVHVEDDFAAEELRENRADDNRVGHRANDHDVVALLHRHRGSALRRHRKKPGVTSK